ncbi:lysophospholipid acyltransferase family protein [Cupriavidus basilensis]|uniref:Lysophospholipid acyltransferase family protein n=1 Tax=Cupriavidus basilensis TaxID=68895 RepID=A0ABT6AT85_9BURK|nr:lysophospholipid acyltransferase family protein [Cupriavidus basilensis]MDF3835588.1 lysophospholipid acyltransferase family protein [Cupriavidus basilensis]
MPRQLRAYLLARSAAAAEHAAFYAGLLLLASLSLLWTPFAVICRWILPAAQGQRLGRFANMGMFRFYLWALAAMGACRFDLRELDSLRGGPPLVLAANHPGLLDALLVLSRLPGVACIMKAGVVDNPFLGAGARLARYIRNDTTVGMIRRAVQELREGGQVLVFPEGTRTIRRPVNAFKGGVGLIAKRAGVPVQTLFIETDSPFLGKGWPFFRKPDMPVCYRVRLGRRFDPPESERGFMAELAQYYEAELSSPEQAPRRSAAVECATAPTA